MGLAFLVFLIMSADPFSMERGEIVNANYNLSEKYLRMIEDDEYFDVTKEDVKILLKRMSHHYSRDDIIKMRIKYDA